MSSEPTSDDATKRDTTAKPEGSAAQSSDATVQADPTAQPVDLGKPDSTPTEVLAAQHDSATEVLNGQGGAQQTAATEWWTDPAAQQVEAPTEVLHPGEAAYAVGANTGPGQPGTGSTATTVLPAGYATDASGGIPAPQGFQPPPGTPPPPMNVGGGEGGSPRKPRNRKKTLIIVGLVVALLVAGGLAGGEAYARNRAEKCISNQFQASMGSKIDVSFGWKPLLLTAFDHKVSRVNVDSDDVKFGPAQGMVVHSVFDDVEYSSDGKELTIGSSNADVTWSTDGITKTLGGLVSATAADANSGTLSFSVLGGLAQLQVKPKIVGDKIEVDTVQASLLGFGLPTDLVSGIVQALTESLQTYPMGLQPTKVEVTNAGLHITLQGGHTQVTADQSQGQQQTVSC
ncbi:LmeA family phospholipid-binding protein [Nocardia heshunensis]